MKKFNFRLQKVLEYRQMLQQWAKEAYLDARSSRLEAELSLHQITSLRLEVLTWRSNTIESRQTIEMQLRKLDQKEVEQRLIVNVLVHEEELALNAWKEKKIELEALNKMYDKQFGEWQLDMDRKLQNELDEWATRKRVA
ncbi:MAG TPA: flagellar FliJ family protein [Fimbriimonadaceae bacterium]|jgi:flagellar export protein FliJ